MSNDTDSESEIDLDEIGSTTILPGLRKPLSHSSEGVAKATSPSSSTRSLDFDDVQISIGSGNAPAQNQDPETHTASPSEKNGGTTIRQGNNGRIAAPIATPSTLKKASAKHKKSRVPIQPEAWLFPPDYANIDFSDDERVDRLERRPQFTEIFPQRVATDIYLPASKGIIPAPISQWLRDYQVHGVAFMHKLFAQQVGGILGDDMGLGKTVQVIAFLTAACGKTGDSRDSKRRRKMRNYTDQWYPRILLVCPGVLMENWKEELNRWGWWDIGVFHGSVASKEEALNSARLGYIEIMITTYTTYLTHMSEVNTVEWDCVIADECHCLKGKKAQITEAMNEVNARCRIGLTGTAIQNDYNELWSLLNWANPDKLGSRRDWSSAITEPLKRGQSHDATLMQLGKARRIARSLVQNLLPRFFLRRTKALIADQLPRKYDRVVFCPLTRTQAEAYKSFLASDMVQSIKRATEECDCGSGRNRGWCCHALVPGFEDKWQSYVSVS